MTSVIVGDVGGTNCRFSLIELREGHREIKSEIFSSRLYSDFRCLLRQFLEGEANPVIAVIGVEGYVYNNTIRFINGK